MADARVDRIKAIAAALYGRVLDRRVETIEDVIDDWPVERTVETIDVEIPADLATSAAGMFGMSGFSANIVGQTTRLAPRRVVNMSGQTVVCDEVATMAYYRFKIDLAPRDVAIETAPHGAAVAATAPTRPA